MNRIYRWASGIAMLFGCAVSFLALSQTMQQPITLIAPPPSPVPPVRTLPKAVPDTCQRPEYPNAALRAELQGTTRVRFDVDSSSKIVGLLVVKSSGHDALDAATLAALRTCEFTAGTYNGKPTLASVFIEFAWRLEEAAPSASTPRQ